MSTSPQKCATCYGEGEVASEFGPQSCSDCGGLGQLPSATVLAERRLRELERIHSTGEVGDDVRWLVAEVRRSQHVLMQIMAAAQDAPEQDVICKKIRFLSNEVLGVYAASND